MKRLAFLLICSYFYLVSVVIAAPITSVTATYTVSSSTASDTGSISAQIDYSRSSSGDGSGSSGSSQAAATAVLSSSSTYNNGLGMNYENYISPEEGALLDQPQEETISFLSTATWEETFLAAENSTYRWATVVPYAQIRLQYDTFNNYLPASTDLTAGFEGVLTVNNTEILRFGSESFFTEGGGYSSRRWGGFGGAPQVNSHAGDPRFLEVTGYWNTGPYTLTSDLGSFDTGDLINIELSISTYIYGTGSQNGAEVFFGNDGEQNGSGVYGYLTPESSPYIPSDPNPSPVPEPATFILLGSGLAGLAFYRRKRK